MLCLIKTKLTSRLFRRRRCEYVAFGETSERSAERLGTCVLRRISCASLVPFAFVRRRRRRTRDKAQAHVLKQL